MNSQHARTGTRVFAGAISAAAVSAAIYALVDDGPTRAGNIWGAAIVVILALGFCIVVETISSCTDRVVAATPKAHHIVCATLDEVERQAARDANLPHIADGQRTR